MAKTLPQEPAEQQGPRSIGQFVGIPAEELAEKYQRVSEKIMFKMIFEGGISPAELLQEVLNETNDLKEAAAIALMLGKKLAPGIRP